MVFVRHGLSTNYFSRRTIACSISRPANVGRARPSSFVSRTARETVDHSASSKLWEDAMREEAEEVKNESSSLPQQLLSQEENWTGEESVRDAVLRMLVDKYKPLRGPVVRSADEKLKQTPPAILSSTPGAGPSTVHYRADEPLLPSVEGHKPWLVTFKPPSHAVNVKVGSIVSGPRTSTRRGLEGLEEGEKKVERGAKRRRHKA